jgi:hypothetical protein
LDKQTGLSRRNVCSGSDPTVTAPLKGNYIEEMQAKKTSHSLTGATVLLLCSCHCLRAELYSSTVQESSVQLHVLQTHAPELQATAAARLEELGQR